MGSEYAGERQVEVKKKYFTVAAAREARLAQMSEYRAHANGRFYLARMRKPKPVEPDPVKPVHQCFLSIPAPLPGSVALSFFGWVWR